MCQFPNIEQAYVVSMPNHNPDRQGPIITGSDINIAGKGKFYLDLFLVFLEPNPIWTLPWRSVPGFHRKSTSSPSWIS